MTYVISFSHIDSFFYLLDGMNSFNLDVESSLGSAGRASSERF